MCVCVCVCVCVKMQLGFNPVAVVQQYNRYVTHITYFRERCEIMFSPVSGYEHSLLGHVYILAQISIRNCVFCGSTVDVSRGGWRGIRPARKITAGLNQAGVKLMTDCLSYGMDNLTC
jgi:hypothetical protein